MTTIQEELQRLIALNYAEKWVPNDLAFQGLSKYGDGLVPGLIECLDDKDYDVRMLTIQLLGESRSEAAIPALIKTLSDADRVIRVVAASILAIYGPKASVAVPILEPWLRHEDGYIRTVALVTILRLDPSSRSILLPQLQQALRDDHPMIRCAAEDYFTGE